MAEPTPLHAVAAQGPAGTRVRVWDLPTRLFHWLLVAGCITQWLTQDDARWTDFHVFTGYVIAALLVFRVAWGLAGTRYARFAGFASSPRDALAHLRATLAGRHQRFVGHNPAGAWSIFLMLGLGFAVVLTGLCAFGGAKQLGPLQGLVGYAAGDTLVVVHKWLAWSLLALVVLHVIGVVAASRAERENLALAMVNGVKRVPAPARRARDRSLGGIAGAGDDVPAAGSSAAILLVSLLVFAAIYLRGYAGDAPYVPFHLAPLAQDATWSKECGGCHVAYHASVLPARSWQAMLAQQDAHFGEDLGLDETTQRTLAAFAVDHAAAAHATPLAWSVDRTTPAGQAPQRITETPYWRERHASVRDDDWARTKRFACDGCHLDANDGTFLPGAIRVGHAAGATAGAGAGSKGGAK